MAVLRLAGRGGRHHRSEDSMTLLRPRDSGSSALLAAAQPFEQPAGLSHDLLDGASAGIGEVAIRIAHPPLRTIVVILDRNVSRHPRPPHGLSLSRPVPGGQWKVTLRLARRRSARQAAGSAARRPA